MGSIYFETCHFFLPLPRTGDRLTVAESGDPAFLAQDIHTGHARHQQVEDSQLIQNRRRAA